MYLVFSLYYSPLVSYRLVKSETPSEKEKSDKKYKVVDGRGYEVLKH